MTEWAQYWSNAGDQRMHCGDHALDTGEFGRACNGYLRAIEYYGLGLSRTNRHQPEHRVLADAQFSAFRCAMPLLPHSSSAFTLEVEGLGVAGYLFLPADKVDPARVALWPVAPHTTAESNYRHVAVPVLEAGLACVLYELTDAEARCRTEVDPSISASVLAKAVMRWALKQPGVDPTTEALLPPSRTHRP